MRSPVSLVLAFITLAPLFCTFSLKAATQRIELLPDIAYPKHTLTIPQSSILLRGEGDDVVVKHPDGREIILTVTRKQTLPNKLTEIVATNPRGDELLLSFDQKATYGSLNGSGMRFSIASDKQGKLILTDHNHQDFPEIDMGHDGLMPPGLSPDKPIMEQMSFEKQLKLSQQMRTAQNQGRSTIRMLILYSSEFGQGFSSPAARINQLLSFTNSSMQRSNINIEFTLAHARQVNFNNSQSTNTTLTQVTNGQGVFSNVESLRDQFAADMVAVLSFQTGFSSNGVAWVNGDDPRFAFSSTRLSPGCCDSVFAHELGHNMGSGHEHASVNPGVASPCSGGGFAVFSCGHGNRNNPNGSWGTIMSRLNSRRANDLFSNPNLTCLGEPCGVPEGQSNPADNFRSFNMTRLLVANFRPDPVQVGPGNPGPSQPIDAGTLPPIIDLVLDEQ